METNNKHILEVPKNNLYVQTLFSIFRQFVLEESIGQLFTEDRLNKKIKMAKELYGAERRELYGNNNFFGRLDSSNAEMILI